MSPDRMLAVDRLIREKSTVTGNISPREFPELCAYLVGNEGEILYSISASARTDASGSQTRRLQCIISGWFLVLDSQTLESKRFSLDVKSRLVLVHREQDLPSLDAEADDEDTVVCGQEFDLIAGLQEEILLALPVGTPLAAGSELGTKRAKAPASGAGEKQNPFAKLAGLKTTNLN